jgi:hypothetical protein
MFISANWEVVLVMKISKTSILIAAVIAFSGCSPAMALTEKSPPRSEDTVDNDTKSKVRKPAETQPARKRDRCNTCRILM